MILLYGKKEDLAHGGEPQLPLLREGNEERQAQRRRPPDLLDPPGHEAHQHGPDGGHPLSPDYWHGNVENAFLCPRCKKVIVDVQTPIKMVTVEPDGDIRDYQDDDE